MAHDATRSLDPEHLLAQAAWIRRLAARLVARASDADDVAQETLHQALRRPPGEGGNVCGWLARGARRVAARMRRGDERRVAHEQSVARATDSAVESADDALLRASLQRTVVDAVIRLAEPYRTAILLHYLDEIPTRDVAERLGVPVETVRTRLKRGLAQLREALANEVEVERSDGRREKGLAALALLVGPPRGVFASAAGGAVVASGLGVFGALTMSLTLKWTAAAVVVVAGGIVVASLATRAPTTLASPSAGFAERATEAAAGAAAPAATAQRAAETADAVAKPGGLAPGPDATTAPTAPRTIHGTVRDDAGSPVAGALVAVEATAKGWLVDARSVCERGRSLLVLESMPDRPAKNAGGDSGPTLGRSGSDGRFELLAPEGPAINLAALDRERGVAVRAGLPLARDAATAEFDLALERGLLVHGQVTDAQGVGLRDAQLWIRTERGNQLDMPRTDANGDYRSLPLPRPDAGKRFWIQASAEEFVDEDRAITTPSRSESDVTADFHLERDRIVRGRVVRSDHEAFSYSALGVKARVLGCIVDPTTLALPRESARCSTGIAEDGTWRLQFDRQDLGWAALFVGDRLIDSAPIVAGEPAPDLVLDVETIAAARPAGALTIRVRDAKDGAPVAAFNVAFAPVRCTLPPATEARPFKRNAESSDGTFTTRELVAATWWLTVKAPGFAPRVVAATATDAVPPPVVVVDLVRPSARVVRGAVVDETGKGVAQANVTIVDRDGLPALAEDVTVVTDAEGRFECSGVPDGRWSVVATPKWSEEGPTHLAAASTAIDAMGDGDVAPLTIVLRDAVRVHVTVRVNPPGLEGPFSFRVLGADGTCLRDDTSAARWVQSFSSRHAWDFFLAPGRATIEAHCAGAKPGRIDVVAEPGATAVVELVQR